MRMGWLFQSLRVSMTQLLVWWWLGQERYWRANSQSRWLIHCFTTFFKQKPTFVISFFASTSIHHFTCLKFQVAPRTFWMISRSFKLVESEGLKVKWPLAYSSKTALSKALGVNIKKETNKIPRWRCTYFDSFVERDEINANFLLHLTDELFLCFQYFYRSFVLQCSFLLLNEKSN